MTMDCFNLLSERIGPGKGCFIPFLLATNDSLFGGSIGRLCGGQAHKGEAAAGTAEDRFWICQESARVFAQKMNVS